MKKTKNFKNKKSKKKYFNNSKRKSKRKQNITRKHLRFNKSFNNNINIIHDKYKIYNNKIPIVNWPKGIRKYVKKRL